MKQFIKASLMLALVLACSTKVFAQDETLEKPTKPQKQTTTTTTKPNKTNSNSQTSSSSTTTTPAPKPTTGTINGHEWVDLGLSVKWATCNVGASSPSEYGNHYAWGETSAKSEYTRENSKIWGKVMGSIAGNPQYDAATANWGGTWRLPLKDEIKELVDKCTWTWTSQGGNNGYKVTGPNGNSIFLPAPGSRNGTFPITETGYYWSATPYKDGTYGAYYLGFTSYYDPSMGFDESDIGGSVRPVLEERVQDETMKTSNSNSQTSSSSQSESSTSTKLSEPTGYINGYGYVDLGLSVKWATRNVGASSASGYGNYYAWGETSTKSEYTWGNSKTHGKSMGSIAGNPQYDAATANWGSTWRMPTRDEINELIKKCTWTWITQGGHEGCKVTGPNGNSIFLPAAGWWNGRSNDSAGKEGQYWSATPPTNSDYDACFLLFDSGHPFWHWLSRSCGYSVRPVSE